MSRGSEIRCSYVGAGGLERLPLAPVWPEAAQFASLPGTVPLFIGSTRQSEGMLVSKTAVRTGGKYMHVWGKLSVTRAAGLASCSAVTSIDRMVVYFKVWRKDLS